MPPAKGEAEGKDAFVAKAAGVAVVSGIAWSIYKSVTTAAKKEAPPPALAPPKGNLGGDGYEVSKGDTLFGISQRCGVSVEALRAANGVHGDDIYAGERLVIPK